MGAVRGDDQVEVLVRGDEPVHQTDGLHRLRIVHRLDGDSGFFLELVEDRLGELAIQRCVNDDLARIGSLFAVRIGRAVAR